MHAIVRVKRPFSRQTERQELLVDVDGRVGMLLAHMGENGGTHAESGRPLLTPSSTNQPPYAAQRRCPRPSSAVSASRANQNEIAQGHVNIFCHLTFFSILTMFATLTGNDASNRLNIIIFVISRSISVEIDTSLALFQKFYFWRSF